MKKTKVIKSDKKQKFDLTKEIVILCSISFDNKKTFKKSKFHRCTWNKHTVETRTFEFFQLLNTNIFKGTLAIWFLLVLVGDV